MAESKQKSWLSDISEKIQIKKKTASDSTAEPSKGEAGNLHKHNDDRPKVSKGKKVAYILLSVVTALVSIILIVASLNVVLVITYASFNQTNRQKGSVVLAASAVVTLALLIAGLVAILKSKRKTAVTVAVLLVIVAAIQALVLGTTVSMKDSDKESISEAMVMSFINNTIKGTSRSKWNFIQDVSKCCGVLGPEDYRDHAKFDQMPMLHIPPNIPIACCKGFDSEIPESEQEANRQRCRFQRAYYTAGCQPSVIYTASSMAVIVTGVGVVLIVLEVLSSVPLFTALKKKKLVPLESKPEGIKVEERKSSVSQNK